MKTNLLVALLACSLAGNAALYISRPTPAPAGPTVNPGSRQTASAGAVPVATTGAGEIAQLAKVRATLQSGDIKTLVEQLRAAGFSESMIRYMVSAQVYEMYSARRKALLQGQEEPSYWQTSRLQGNMDAKTRAALRDLGREQSERLKELLGPAGTMGNDEMQVYQRRAFGSLTKEKIDQLQRIISDYSDLRSDIYASANGLILPEDREKVALLEKEQRADIAAVLTPEEFENYELRSSSTANTLRSQLSAFKPTEQEFRAIFQATRAAEEKYGSLTTLGGNPNQMRQVQAAVLEQAQTLLTPERYADLKQATDPAYQLINRLVARLDLPATTAPQVVNLQQDIMKRATTVRADQSITADQRNTQLSALLQEATTNLTNVLGGPRGLEAYKQYGGQWLQMLQPRPAPPPRG